MSRLTCVGCAHRFGKVDHAAKELEPSPLCARCARLVLRRGYGLLGAFTLVARS